MNGLTLLGDLGLAVLVYLAYMHWPRGEREPQPPTPDDEGGPCG